MSKRKKIEAVDVEDTLIDEPHVVQYLDRDPNDPRKRPVTQPLPSLDD